MITNAHTGTNLQEIADGIYRINTPVEIPGGAFSFNQYLVDDAEPLLFHTGPRRLFPLVSEAVRHVLPPESLRWIAFSHFEADECGSLNEWLALAPAAQPLCSTTAAMVSVADVADREPRALTDGETLSTGRRTLRWFDTPHLPHGWETGYLADESTRTLFCGDLFTQPGTGDIALTESDILGPSEAFRGAMDYYAHSKHAAPLFAKLAAFEPQTLAVMHGSAWRGDGAALLRELARAVEA
ncbi:MAG TPA: FprA family A-type flavoprotein [Thermoanaerobaculia bacterium]|jgi:flavorubredoxin|nr:FprA family A-type flavoprotein [Thermoanaerobaculia bacterium]